MYKKLKPIKNIVDECEGLQQECKHAWASSNLVDAFNAVDNRKGAKVYRGSPAEAPPRPPGACSTTTGVLRPGLGPARAKDCCLSDVVPQPPVFGRRLLRCQPLATDLSLTQN